MFTVPAIGKQSSQDVCEMIGMLEDWRDAGVDMLSTPTFLTQVFRLNQREAVAVLSLWLVLRPGHAHEMN